MARNRSKCAYANRTFNLPVPLIDLLNRYSEEQGVSCVFVVEKAVTEWLGNKGYKVDGGDQGEKV